MLRPAFGVMRPKELVFILANSARRGIREPSFKILDLYEYGVIRSFVTVCIILCSRFVEFELCQPFFSIRIASRTIP